MREAKDLSGALRKMLRRVDPEGRRDKPRVVDAWRRAAGEEIVRHSLGYDVRSGELLVFVDGPAWATELAAMSEHLRERVNEELGTETVRSIRFAVSKQVRQQAAAEERRRAAQAPAPETERVELTGEQMAEIERRAKAVPSDDLREAVVRAMAADARRGRRAEKDG